MKLQLTVDSGSLAGRTFDLETGFLTVGRGETCSVRFDPMSERIASKQHAFIEAKADGYYVSDNQSTNGTLVNGSVITSTKLANGDQIQFGRNGVTATVSIGGESGLAPVPQEQFRAIQAEQYNQAAVASSQTSLRNSISNIGLGSMPVVKPEPSKVMFWVLIGVGLAIAIPLAVFVVLLLSLDLKPLPAVIATVVAFLPAVLYLTPLVWLDRYDPEPFWLLCLAFLWGALVSMIVSFIINSIFAIVLAMGLSPQISEVLTPVISAPIFEEASKGFGVLLIFLVFRKYFDDVLDGIVFAGFVALGFATVENILYYGRVIGTWDIKDFLVIFLVRGILSPFAHVSFTAMTGIGCGLARETHKKWLRFLAPVIGYIAAVSLHAIWNGFSMVVTALIVGLDQKDKCVAVGLGGEWIGLCGFFAGYIVLEVPLFLIILGFTIYFLRRQRRILTEMLAIDIARGLLSQEHVDKATSAIKSTLWRLQGLTAGKFMARSRYLRAVGKLGLSYWHIQRATVAHGQTGSFQQNPILREEVLKWRDKV